MANEEYVVTEEQFRESLNIHAEAIANDIKGDFPHMDTSWEAYVYVIDNKFVGYIYMGECGEWSLVVKDGFDTCDDSPPEAPVALWDEPVFLERARAMSPYKNW